MKPIYKPKGAAGEYGDYAINIYTGCNHGCTYCYARSMHNRFKPNIPFDRVEVRPGLLDALEAQLDSGAYHEKLIHLCFTCDPYPADVDTTATREVIRMIKAAGAHVQILTKGGDRALRDLDLLDSDDWFGVTYTGHDVGELFSPIKAEPNAANPAERLHTLGLAHKRGIKTWMSCEPVLNPDSIIEIVNLAGYVDLFKIGKLNYHPSDTDWRLFGKRIERECVANHRNYYIKADLRREMEAEK